MAADDAIEDHTALNGQEPDAPQRMQQRPALTLDVALYQHLLDDSDMTDAEKHEFLEALWSIIVAFVDLGFGIHPVQQVLDGGSGKPGSEDKVRASASDDVVKSPNKSPTTRFETAAGPHDDGRAGR